MKGEDTCDKPVAVLMMAVDGDGRLREVWACKEHWWSLAVQLASQKRLDKAMELSTKRPDKVCMYDQTSI